MSKRTRITAVEKKHGALQEVIPRLLDKHNGNQRMVADSIGLSPAFISRWLRRHNYIQVIQWVKCEEPA